VSTHIRQLAGGRSRANPTPALSATEGSPFRGEQGREKSLGQPTT
jgi:hypothetical protein